MRVRLTDTTNKPEAEQIYHASIEGFVRRPKRSWDDVFAQFEQSIEPAIDSEEAEAETEHEAAQSVR